MEHSQETKHFVRVGKVKDAHGIKGELFVILFAGEAAWLESLKTLTLLPSEDAAPEQAKNFAIKSARLHKGGLIVKTEEIRDRNEAESLKGWLLEIPDSFLISKPGEQIYLREIEGFKVVTKALGLVGTIEAFSTNGIQDLLVVRTARGDFEVPFVEAFVERIDYEAKTLHMDLPEGLLGELDGDEAQ